MQGHESGTAASLFLLRGILFLGRREEVAGDHMIVGAAEER
jgi:hypothetical protein